MVPFLKILSYSFTALLIFSFQPMKKSNSAIRIYLDGAVPKKGQILVSLFSAENGFPDQNENAFQSWVFQPSKELVLENIPPDTYAISLLHDLDNNKKMSYSFIGIPTDGYSSSPDGGSRFFKPKFQDSKFLHSEKGTDLHLKVYY
jgi:uncharacterized protein (DUF2141 family)